MKFCMKCMSQYDDKFTLCPSCAFEEGTLPNDSRCMEPGSILGDRYIVGMPLRISEWMIRYIGWDALTNRRVVINEYCPQRYCTRSVGQIPLTIVKEKAFYRFMTLLFKRAQILSGQHLPDNISTVHEAFEKNNTAYIITEYTEGETLTEYIKNKAPMQYPTVEKLFIPMIRSLDKLHDGGYVSGGFTTDDFIVTEEHELILYDYLENVLSHNPEGEETDRSRLMDKYYPPERFGESDVIDPTPEKDVYSVAAMMLTLMGVTLPDNAKRKQIYETKHRDILKKPSAYHIKTSAARENALINASYVDPSFRTPEMETFLKELTSTKPVSLRFKGDEKIPVWAKIAIPTAAVALIVAAIIFIPMLLNNNQAADTYDGQTVVPALSGVLIDDANEQIKKAGLYLEIQGKEINDGRAENQIIRQEPAEGTIVDEKSVVSVVINMHSGQFSLPNFLGVDINSCTDVLEGIGLNYSVSHQYHHTIGEGCVVSQSITPYSMVTAGQRIELVVSDGPDPASQGDEPTEAEELVGKTYDDIASGSGYDGGPVQVTDRVYDDSVPEGTVLEQYPPAGSQLEGEPVQVVVSTANKDAAVPDVTLTNSEKAVSLLEMYGFEADISSQESDSYSEGLVMTQEPAGGKIAQIGDTVRLTVSSGRKQTSVPDLTGKTKSEADKLLHDAGFAALFSYEKDSKAQEDTVLRQEPSANTQASLGTTVTVYLSSGADVVEVPDLSGLDEKAAELTLSRSGLKYDVYRDFNHSAEKGTVIGQFPEAGILVRKEITVYVVLEEKEPVKTKQDIRISPENVTLRTDETFVLDIETEGIDDLYSVNYDIDNKEIIDVSYIDRNTLSMTFRAKEPGQTVVAISCGDIRRECSVTVTGESKKPASDLFTISPENVSIKVKEKFVLTIDTGSISDLKAFQYDISDTSVVEVRHIDTKTLAMTFSGLKPGTAYIDISYGSVKKRCKVTVS